MRDLPKSDKRKALLTQLHDYKQWFERNKRVVLIFAAVLFIGLWTFPALSQEQAKQEQDKQDKKDTAFFYKGQEFLEKKDPEAAIENFRELIDHYLGPPSVRDLSIRQADLPAESYRLLEREP